jgi:hypothetical protein
VLDDATVKYQNFPEDSPLGAEVGAFEVVVPDELEVPLKLDVVDEYRTQL